MLKISFSGNSDQRLIAKLQEKGPLIIQVLATKLNALMIQLQRYVVTEKLAGQVLHRRSGTLADSVRVLPTEIAGNVIRGAVEGAGGPAFYGVIHEYGAVFTVKERAMAHVAGKHRAGRFLIHGALGTSHVVNIPARPFMAPSLAENAAMIEAELRAILDEELAK